MNIIDGYERWRSELVQLGWKPYLLSFLFKELHSSHTEALATINAEITRFYSTILTRIVRRPNQQANRGQMPILIGFPDLPVEKRKNLHSVAYFRPNNGLHAHALYMVPPNSRKVEDLKLHVHKNARIYTGDSSWIASIDVTAITDPNGSVVDYVFKHLKRGNFTSDNVLILPRTTSEMLSRL